MTSRRASRVEERQTVHILGVPLDHGAGRRGVGMGPSALRIAGLAEKLTAMGLEVTDHGDVLIRDMRLWLTKAVAGGIANRMWSLPWNVGVRRKVQLGKTIHESGR